MEVFRGLAGLLELYSGTRWLPLDTDTLDLVRPVPFRKICIDTLDLIPARVGVCLRQGWSGGSIFLPQALSGVFLRRSIETPSRRRVFLVA